MKDYVLLTDPKYGIIKTILRNKKLRHQGNWTYRDINEAQKQYEEQGKVFRDYAREIVDFLGPTRGRPGVRRAKLLDVGCGLGWVVAEANQRGFNAIGIDPAGGYVEIGKKLLKVDLRRASLEKFEAKQKFDVVILKHILEHIEKPDLFLAKIHRLLKPSGLVVVACPNIKSLMFWLYRDRWYGLSPFQHVWQFTPETLSNLLSRNKFQVTKIKVGSLAYNTPGWKAIVFKTLVLIANLTGYGDQVFVLATRS